MFVGDRLIQNLISVKLKLLADEKKSLNNSVIRLTKTIKSSNLIQRESEIKFEKTQGGFWILWILIGY